MHGKTILFTLMATSAAFGDGLKVGAGTSVITPFLDHALAGYYFPRTAEGVHDDLQAKALLFDDGRDRVVLVACDTIGMNPRAAADARRRIRERLNIPEDHVLISATHCHTGPVLDDEYVKGLGQRIADSVVTAAGNRKPVRLSVTTENEGSLPHYRRYRMKDGSVVTNPGFLNPDVVAPVGEIDPRVPVVYGEDERGAPVFTWVNYAMHLDTVGGTWISADYAYFLARMLAKVKGPDMLTVFTIGPAGNINHWDVKRPGPQRGFGEAQRLGEVLSSAVVKACTHLEPVAEARVRAASGTLRLPIPKVTPEEIAWSKKVLAVPPRTDVDFTLERVKASRVADTAKRKGEDLVCEVQVVAVGPVAFVAIPGELFVELGRDIQRNSPFPYTFVVTLANDSLNYIPTRAAFDEGAYEPTSARMAPGGGELIVVRALELLQQLKGQ